MRGSTAVSSKCVGGAHHLSRVHVQLVLLPSTDLCCKHATRVLQIDISWQSGIHVFELLNLNGKCTACSASVKARALNVCMCVDKRTKFPQYLRFNTDCTHCSGLSRNECTWLIQTALFLASTPMCSKSVSSAILPFSTCILQPRLHHQQIVLYHFCRLAPAPLQQNYFALEHICVNDDTTTNSPGR